MKTLLKWASWLVSAVAILFIIIGTICYLLGNIEFFGVKWGTLYLFGGYFMPLAILLILLDISCREKCKE
jgi:predicted anti-sigma-YlaC factor YlaD